MVAEGVVLSQGKSPLHLNRRTHGSALEQIAVSSPVSEEKIASANTLSFDCGRELGNEEQMKSNDEANESERVPY